jgi:hypothetical protein
VPAKVLYESATARTNRRWYEGFHPAEETPEEATDAAAGVDPALARFRPRRRTPSGSEIITVSAAQLFSRKGGEAREFGTLVHALFEAIEWSDTFDLEALAAEWTSRHPGSGSLADALDQVRGVLAVPALHGALAKPGPHAEVWREKNFEILLGEEWLSGTFDRVVIERERTDAPPPPRFSISRPIAWAMTTKLRPRSPNTGPSLRLIARFSSA